MIYTYICIYVLSILALSALRNVELIASKAYHASGVVAVTVIYDVSDLSQSEELF